MKRLLMKPEDYATLDWFSAEEFDRPELLQKSLLYRLNWARTLARLPFQVTSDFREHSRGHSMGAAIDLRCWTSGQRWVMLGALYMAGFKRIGVYDRHIEANVLNGEDVAIPALWTGKSRRDEHATQTDEQEKLQEAVSEGCEKDAQ